jgi:hypothetical protein
VRRTTLPFLALSALAAACLVAPVTAPASAATNGRELDLTFDSARTLSRQSGDAALTIRTLTHDGGAVRSVTGYDGSGAARFPAFARSNPPMAILTVVDQTGADDLEPAKQEFRFGADFSLDATSQTSSVDNGNNLIQRGLFNGTSQYKIELDSDRPKCRVMGGAGAVLVKATSDVSPGTWYRASCFRDGSRVTLTVKRLSDGKKWTYEKSGAIGSLTYKSSIPLTVGGKAKSPSRIFTKASDQFNGKVDNAFVNLLG